MSNTIGYRFDVLRDGAFYKSLRAELGGNVMCRADAAVKRSVRCTLKIPDDVDFLTDELRVAVVKNGTEHQLGVFVVTTQSKTVTSDGRAVYSVDGYDRSYKVDRRRIESRSEAYIRSGTKYTDAIESLLISSGISTAVIEASPLTIATDREDWDVGTSMLTIVNQLLDEINYSSLWIDSNGFARCGPYQADDKPLDFAYTAGPGSVILQEHSVSNDVFNSYNVFTVCANRIGDSAPIYVTAVNDDATSKISTVRRGRIAAPITMLNDVSNLDTARAYAQNLVKKSRMSSETATIRTEVEGGHEVEDAVSVFIPELSGRFVETSWTIPLDGSPLMTHTLRRALYV